MLQLEFKICRAKSFMTFMLTLTQTKMLGLFWLERDVFSLQCTAGNSNVPQNAKTQHKIGLSIVPGLLSVFVCFLSLKISIENNRFP